VKKLIMYFYQNGGCDVELDGEMYEATRVQSARLESNNDNIPVEFIEWDLKKIEKKGELE